MALKQPQNSQMFLKLSLLSIPIKTAVISFPTENFIYKNEKVWLIVTQRGPLPLPIYPTEAKRLFVSTIYVPSEDFTCFCKIPMEKMTLCRLFGFINCFLSLFFFVFQFKSKGSDENKLPTFSIPEFSAIQFYSLYC